MHLVKASFTAHELKCSLRTGVCELCDLVRRGCGQSVRSRSRWTQCCCSGVMGLVLSTFSYLETISGRSCSCFCPCENCLAYVTGWTVRMTTVISRASNSRFESILFDSLCESIRIYSFCKKIGLSIHQSPPTHLGHMGDRFYRSIDPTNSVKH